jgi:hypothetical protein
LAVTETFLNETIADLAPLNNEYRRLRRQGGAALEILAVMWRVGEILHKATSSSGVSPHTLFWGIYGKAPGVKRSFITRDFLSYCYRIRRMYASQEELSSQLRGLQSYSLFREAIPLLENERYRLKGERRDELLRMLNSKLPVSQLKAWIADLKKQVIGRKNSRTQRLAEVEPWAQSFRSIVLALNSGGQSLPAKTASAFRDANKTRPLAEAVSSLTREGLFVPALQSEPVDDGQFDKLVHLLIQLTSGPVELRNRFRRLFPPKALMDFAEMLFSYCRADGSRHR